MPKESTNEKSGAPDGLQKAAQQISEVDDNQLAQMFIEANNKALMIEEAELFEIYSEKEEHYEFEEKEPDPALLKKISDSLINKEFHHKKLLEEDTPFSFFGRLFFNLKKIFSIPIKTKKEFIISPFNWKSYLITNKFWRKKLNLLFDDFSSYIDLLLRNKENMRQILKHEGIIFLSSFVLNLILLFNLSSIFTEDLSSKPFISTWSSFINFFSLSSLILILIPPSFLTILWFVNVNFLYASKNFHFFLFIFFTLSYFFLFLALFNIFVFVGLTQLSNFQELIKV